MDKLAISRLATLPQQAKPLKQDPGAKVRGDEDTGEKPAAITAGQAAKPAIAQKQDSQDQGFLQRLGVMQKLADEAFVNQDLRLSISFDEAVGRFIYRGLDRETGEVKREFPPEELLNTIVALRKIAGIAVDRKL
jgi:flagellar protein FlaG